MPRFHLLQLCLLVALGLEGVAAFAPAARAAALPSLPPARAVRAATPLLAEGEAPSNPFAGLFGGGNNNAAASKKEGETEDEEAWTLDKVASLGLAGVLSIAVAETVFWVLSFPTSELLYFLGTGEWIDLFSQEGQIKFLAFTAGWGALGGVIAQYRTVLTAAAMTPWMDECVLPCRSARLEAPHVIDVRLVRRWMCHAGTS